MNTIKRLRLWSLRAIGIAMGVLLTFSALDPTVAVLVLSPMFGKRCHTLRSGRRMEHCCPPGC
ncbi:MAG: hypothetical protein R3E84_05045 [Pseudomonadales bacterium]